LTIDVRQTLPEGLPETNYGGLKISGSAVLAGELNIETERFDSRPVALGQRFEIVDAGEVAGALSGEFTLGDHCITKQPGEGWRVNYKPGSKGTVTLEAANVAGC
jgi:hypothetical protein